MPEASSSRRQGDVGEAHAFAWLTEVGAVVSAPLFHSPDYDAIAQFGGSLFRIQVKTSRLRRGSRFKVQVATSGGNRSWTGAVKYFDRHRCDFLFVRLIDGRTWFIPAAAVDGATSISLGGPKYSEFQIKAPGEMPAAAARHLQCSASRGSAGVGEPGLAVNQVPRAERVRIPPPPYDTSFDRAPEPVSCRSTGRSRLSPGHQMTVPIGPFRAAQLAAGDQFEVTAEGPGEVHLSRVHAVEDRTVTTRAATAPAAGA